MQQNVRMQNNVMKYFCHHTKMENKNDDISDVSDLPYDEICINLGRNKYMTPRLMNLQSICYSK